MIVYTDYDHVVPFRVRSRSQIIVVIYQATPALFATPDVHQNALLSTVADYTYACFIPVIVSTLCGRVPA